MFTTCNRYEYGKYDNVILNNIVINEFIKIGNIVDKIKPSCYGNEKTVGVYLIFHLESQKAYVGSHSDLFNRRCEHLSQLRRNIHPVKKLQELFNIDDKIIIYFMPTNTREEAYDIEQHMLDKFHTLDNKYILNTSPTARTTLGSIRSPESRERYRLSKLGIPKSPEHAAKIRERNMLKAKRISIDGVEYESIHDASRKTGLHRPTIKKRLLSDDIKFSTYKYV